MLKQLQDANGVALFDSNNQPLMYESVTDEASETPNEPPLENTPAAENEPPPVVGEGADQA